MPANLNALIRYKTIDRLLGTGRKYTIHELREHCTAALEESKGMDRMVSKRTIQEDIRVLRSDILGFNAPIENRWGYYYYSEPNYSIFETRISNLDILKRVYDFLFGIREAVNDIRLDLLLAEIGEVLPEKVWQTGKSGTVVVKESKVGEEEVLEHADETAVVLKYMDKEFEEFRKEPPGREELGMRFSVSRLESDQPQRPIADQEAEKAFIFSWDRLRDVLD